MPKQRRAATVEAAVHVTPPARPATPAEARALWLAATEQAQLDTVAAFYRQALMRAVAQEEARENAHEARSAKRRRAEEEVESACVEDADNASAQLRGRLLLLLVQSGLGNSKEALALFAAGGFVARLASCVLNYDLNAPPVAVATPATAEPKAKPLVSAPVVPCAVVDNALPKAALAHLRRALLPVDADYWTAHSYSVEPPSPYFSFAFPTDDDTLAGMGALGVFVQTVRSIASEHWGPARVAKVRFAEVWAHNRPHASGHQLHFDSDDEGRGANGPQHPVCSGVVFLSRRCDVGGPTLVTNQTLREGRLATKGWLAGPRPNRVVVFDGSVLHGVVPGKGVTPTKEPSPVAEGAAAAAEDRGRGEPRRVTLMIALWERLTIRSGPEPGSSRAFPAAGSADRERKRWAAQLTAPVPRSDTAAQQKRCFVDPIPVPRVWERADGSQWPPGGPIPEYNSVFQGF